MLKSCCFIDLRFQCIKVVKSELFKQSTWNLRSIGSRYYKTKYLQSTLNQGFVGSTFSHYSTGLLPDLPWGEERNTLVYQGNTGCGAVLLKSNVLKCPLLQCWSKNVSINAILTALSFSHYSWQRNQNQELLCPRPGDIAWPACSYDSLY